MNADGAPAAPGAAPAPRRGSAIRTGILYSAAHYAAAGLSSVAGLLVRLWVPAAAFGAGAVVTAAQEYFRAYDALYRNAVDREVPGHLARGDEEGARAVVGASYLMLVASLLVESALMVGAGLLTDDPLLRLAWWVYAGVNVLDGINQADRITLKATQRFGAHNRALVLGGLLGSAALIGCSWAWGTRGYFAGVAANAALYFVMYRVLGGAHAGRPTLRGVSGPVLRRVLSVGVLVSALKLSQQLLFTADRWVVVGTLGVRELGYYSLGIAVASRLYLLPQSLVGSFSPRLNAMLATGRMDEAREAVRKLQRASCLVSACSCGVVVVAIGPLVDRVLPEYAGAVPALQVMLAGTYFMAMNATSLQVHVGLGRIRPGVLAALGGAALSAVLGLALVRFGLAGVAAARAAGIAAYAVALDASTRRALDVRGLALPTLAGAAALGLVLALLATAGPLAAAGWLAVFAAWSVRDLMATFHLRAGDLPGLLRRRRGAAGGAGKGP